MSRPAGQGRPDGGPEAAEPDAAREAGPARRGRTAAAPKPLGAERIRAVAGFYLAQREGSAQMLREVLERRLMRRLRALGPEEAAAERAAAIPLIEAEIARLAGAGALDDRRYAEMKARSALATGRGARRILRDLDRKGVDPGTARDALLGAAREAVREPDEAADASEALVRAELEAAHVLARKRRFGPYRAEPLPEPWAERSRIWRREAGAMARAGFGVEVIRRVLGGEIGEE